ncbi:MAG TPA: hypothetical protein VD794_16350 [Flavisolibacter sp.]|nr:hypothetical protein [Flavisolibacter sp.]
MDAQTRQAALNNISAEDLQKLQQHQAKTSGAFKVDDEWLLLAEFAKAFGWEAYRAAKNDEVSLAEMMTLIEANRKLGYLQMYKDAQSTFVGAGSAQSKSPAKTFNALTKDLVKNAKADE